MVFTVLTRPGRYTTPCKAAVILYMHNIAACATDANLAVQKHLDTFRSTLPQGSVNPEMVHVVPIIDRGIKKPVPEQRFSQQMTLLEQQAAQVKASMFHGIFEASPEIAWTAVQELLEREAHRTETVIT